MPMHIAVFCSGQGSNLQALLDAGESGRFQDAKISLVVSDQPQSQALARAARSGVETLVWDARRFPTREQGDAQLAGEMERRRIGLICLAGYLKILSPEFVRKFPLRILNIHPALLPAFGGPGMYGHKVHEAVLASGAKYSGCTVHFVDEGTDTGPIVLQSAVPVQDRDTVRSLAERILTEEHRLYPLAVDLFCRHRLRVQGKRVSVEEKS